MKVCAFLIEWVEHGRVVDVSLASGYPVTQSITNTKRQRLGAKVLGHSYEDARDRIMRMLDKVDPDVAAELRRKDPLHHD